MRKVFSSVFVCLIIATMAFADHDENDDKSGELILKDGSKVIKVTVGPEKERYSNLVRRVRELEEAVAELQNRCLEVVEVEVPSKEIWSCRIEGKGDIFYGTGPTRGTAEKVAVEECKSRVGGFWCQDSVDCTNE